MFFCYLQPYIQIYLHMQKHVHWKKERRMSDRINEHVPKKIWMNTHRNYSSLKAIYVLKIGHRVDADWSFQVITRKKTTALLRVAEAVAIQKSKSNLCPKGNDYAFESTLGTVNWVVMSFLQLWNHHSLLHFQHLFILNH